jgi:nucleoside-diphosphate-sugar epimerase
MRKPVVLITGAGGEIGHSLIEQLVASGRDSIVTLDVNALQPGLAKLVRREFTGSITDKGLLERILSEFEIDTVYHLAALLSTRSEITPVTAHQVNVEGTLNLLEFSQREAESHGRPVLFLYPSSIAAYGLPTLEVKQTAARVREDDYNTPSTMYGCNKLYCEQLGRYYAHFYKQLAAETQSHRVDFRCVRFPGLISAITVPSGGTSDYAPEMIHAAAKGEPYDCFVRPDTRIPFMTMPDGVKALLALAAAPRERLTRTAYNLSAFSPSAEEIVRVLHAFPCEHRLARRHQASGHRRFVARTWTIPPRRADGISRDCDFQAGLSTI